MIGINKRSAFHKKRRSVVNRNADLSCLLLRPLLLPDPFPNVEQTLTDIRDDITESMQHDGAAETHHHQSSDPKKAE